MNPQPHEPPAPTGGDAANAASTTVGAAAVVCPQGVLDHAEVVVRAGVVTEVRPATSPVPDVVLVPGFVELQVNGIGDIDVAGARGDDWDVLDGALLAQGVTTWCPTLTSAPLDALEASLERVAAAARRAAPGRPAIAGAHLEGPFLVVPGAHRPAWLRGSIDLGWLRSATGAARVVTLAPELPGMRPAVEQLCERGVLVALGHSTCDAETAIDAADAGARLVTHLGNAMGTLHPRSPGLVGVALTDGRLAVSVIADLVHSHAVFLRLAFAAKGPDATVLVTDAVAAGAGAGTPPRLPDGTLAGSDLTMDAAVSTAVAAGATSLSGAVTAASTTPARLLALDDRGAIAPGRRADLVALAPGEGGRWSVASVWVAGVPAWSR